MTTFVATVNGIERNFKFGFQYERHTHGKLKGMPRATLCMVKVIGADNTEYLFGVGRSATVKGDMFDRRIGRKLAAQRALTGITPEVRKAFWEKFLLTHKVK